MSDLRDELYSLLVPLSGERLIVPRACVAEVIGYQPPAQMTNAPPWYAGLVNWSGRSVPVVSFEGTMGQPLPSVSSRFAERAPVICQVRMVNETPLIPDLQRLEQMIAEETSVMT